MNLYQGIIALFVLILLENLINSLFYQNKPPWRHIIDNLNSGHILLWMFRGVEILVYNWCFLSFSTDLVTEFLPNWAVWLSAFFLWDFCFYWLHRLHHSIPVLWAVHEVHHDADHFDLSLGVRNSWYSSLTSIPFFLIMAIMGYPLKVFILIGAIHYFVQFYNHNNLIKNSGILEYFMVTPSLHKVHHGTNEIYINKNCGGTLNIWDKMFGTFQPEIPEEPIKLGISEPLLRANPFLVNNIPLLNFLKVRVNQINRDPAKIKLPIYLISSGGLILFGEFIYFIYMQEYYTFSHLSPLFTVIFLASIINSAMLDGARWSAPCWIGIVMINLIITYVVYASHILLTLFALLLVIHGLIVLRSYLSRKSLTL